MHNAHKKFFFNNNIKFEITKKENDLEMIKLIPYSSNSFVSWRKVELIIIHYTASNFSSAIHTFYNKNSVSAHFLIDIDGSIFNLVNENKRAYHAARSAWKNTKNLINCNSIGIELVNPGFYKSLKWKEFTKDQLDSCEKLTKYLKVKHNIKSTNIIGHSDVNSKKQDPGPLFPWCEFGNWIDNSLLNNNYNITPSIQFLLDELKQYGYNITTDSIHNNAMIQNFRMHFVDNNKLSELNININSNKKLYECCLFAFLLNKSK